MKVRLRTRQRQPRLVHPILSGAMNRCSVEAKWTHRQQISPNLCPSSPPVSDHIGQKNDGEQGRHRAANTIELQHQVVPRRGQLYLGVLTAWTRYKDLDHLVLPQPIDRAGWDLRWRRIAIKWRPNTNLQPILCAFEVHFDHVVWMEGETIEGVLNPKCCDGRVHGSRLARHIQECFVSRPCVVQKYGGSSVADVDQLRAVAARVVATRRGGVDVVVVVSAMGNTTNELLALARAVSAKPGRREIDLLISVGERVAMTLLAMAIADLGEPAQSFTGSQSGIITDSNHVSADVIEVRPHRIRRALDEGQIAIVAGFQGVSIEGEVTTLGRGGSDTTAVVLAAALGAEYCEICSDVDGIFTADPRSVVEAQRIDTLSMDTAIAMAQAGTKILGAEALEKAKAHHVVLVASGTDRPAGSGTKIKPELPSQERVTISRDEGLYLAPTGSNLSGLNGAIKARLPDGRSLIDGRNLGSVETWDLGVVPTPVAMVSALGRVMIAQPERTAAAERALYGVAPGATWWAIDGRFCAVVERSAAQAVEAALHKALIAG